MENLWKLIFLRKFSFEWLFKLMEENINHKGERINAKRTNVRGGGAGKLHNNHSLKMSSVD